MRCAPLDVGDESDAAGILVERGIVESLHGRQPGIAGILLAQGANLKMVDRERGWNALIDLYSASSTKRAMSNSCGAELVIAICEVNHDGAETLR